MSLKGTRWRFGSPFFGSRCSSAILLILLAQVTWAAEDNGDSSGSGMDSSAAAVLASVGVVGAGFMIVVICTFEWWRRQYRKLCPLPPPPDPEPQPVFGGGRGGVESYGSMRTLDASNLESDSRVTIEPLPSLEFLNEVVARYNVTETGDARLSFGSIGSQADPGSDETDTDTNGTAHAILSHEVQFQAQSLQRWFDESALSFPRSKLNYVQEVGSGWFGLVIESEAKDISLTEESTQVVVQALREEASEREQQRFLDQATVYRDSQSKNVMKLLGHCVESIPMLLILEYYPQGDLKAFLLQMASGTVLLDNAAAAARNQMALDLASGLQWMHSQGLTHPDLATRNCMVGAAGQVVIGDYGLAHEHYREDYYWGKRDNGMGVPLRWVAPESLTVTLSTIRTHKATPEANIWSFGVTLWEICELANFPYSELSDEHVLRRVISDRNYTLRLPSIAMLPHVVLRDRMTKLITACCHGVPDKRPSIQSLVQQLQLPL